MHLSPKVCSTTQPGICNVERKKTLVEHMSHHVYWSLKLHGNMQPDLTYPELKDYCVVEHVSSVPESKHLSIHCSLQQYTKGWKMLCHRTNDVTKLLCTLQFGTVYPRLKKCSVTEQMMQQHYTVWCNLLEAKPMQYLGGKLCFNNRSKPVNFDQGH